MLSICSKHHLHIFTDHSQDVCRCFVLSHSLTERRIGFPSRDAVWVHEKCMYVGGKAYIHPGTKWAWSHQDEHVPFAGSYILAELYSIVGGSAQSYFTLSGKHKSFIEEKIGNISETEEGYTSSWIERRCDRNSQIHWRFSPSSIPTPTRPSMRPTLHGAKGRMIDALALSQTLMDHLDNPLEGGLGGSLLSVCVRRFPDHIRLWSTEIFYARVFGSW